jgi:hypothetical protein
MATKTTSKPSSPAKSKRPSKPPARLDGALMAETAKPAPTHAEIAFRAFELYQLRGSDGGALNDWLAAEQELRAS